MRFFDVAETATEPAATAVTPPDPVTQQALAEVRQGRADRQAELEEMKLARTLPAPQEYAIAGELKKQLPFITVVRPSDRASCVSGRDEQRARGPLVASPQRASAVAARRVGRLDDQRTTLTQ